jgi:hypothetical protein
MTFVRSLLVSMLPMHFSISTHLVGDVFLYHYFDGCTASPSSVRRTASIKADTSQSTPVSVSSVAKSSPTAAPAASLATPTSPSPRRTASVTAAPRFTVPSNAARSTQSTPAKATANSSVESSPHSNLLSTNSAQATSATSPLAQSPHTERKLTVQGISATPGTHSPLAPRSPLIDRPSRTSTLYRRDPPSRLQHLTSIEICCFVYPL